MSSPSKTKGSTFEREVAKHLSDLYQESFIRAPGSGAFIGGKNQSRKEFLHEDQVRNFKGDIVPGQSFPAFNCECKNYADFPFNLLFAGKCKVLDSWLNQMMDVAEPDDMSILFIKVTRKGKFVCVQAKYTWVTDNFLYYSSEKHGDWIMVDYDQFFMYNKDLLKAYSAKISTQSTT